MCIVAKNNYIYFIGGETAGERILINAERYDLVKHKLDKIADIQEPRAFACGFAVHGKVYVIGGTNPLRVTIKVYNETINK